MSRLPAALLERPVAHRGLHDAAAGRPENALSALRAAAEAGYGIEFDVQASADGEAMVFHDETLDRMTDSAGPVRARTAVELGRISLRGGGGERIPTLAEALALLAPLRAPLLVEIKPQAPEIGVGPLESRAAALLAAYPGPAAVMSFDPARAIWFRTHAPALPRGLVSLDFEADPKHAHRPAEERAALARLADFETAAADFVSYRWSDLPRAETAALRARRVPVICWTTRSPSEDAAARRHADNVTFEHYRPGAACPAP